MDSTTQQTSGRSGYSLLQLRLRLPAIPALDGIRAICVFLVIFYHLGFERNLPFVPGPLGVLGFFVLSGFLITWLLIKEQEKSGSISLKSFYRRRSLRIFPAFYVFWLVAVGSRLVAHGEGQMPWSQAFSAFFYVSNYFHAIFHPSPDFILHTWSLSAEEQFYLLWPLTFLMFGRKRRRLIGFLACVIAAIWVHRIHSWMTTHAAYYITYAFDTRADALLVGCLLALLLKEGIAQRLFEKICRPAWAPLFALSLLGISELAGRFSGSYYFTCLLAVEPFLVAVLICQLVLHSSTWPWKWLDSSSVIYLGRISYPLYLYHMLATHIAIRIADRIPGLSSPMFVIIDVFVAIAIASCSYHFVEQPFLALKTKSSTLPRAAGMPLVTPQVCRESDSAAPTVP